MSDESEEGENGRRKQAAPLLTSPQTYERDQAISEQLLHQSREKWPSPALAQDGLGGCRSLLLCVCLHQNKRAQLALYDLCEQLGRYFCKPGQALFTVLRGSSHTAFAFPEGNGQLRCCPSSCSMFQRQTFKPVVPNSNRRRLLANAASKEWEENGEPALRNESENESDDEGEAEEQIFVRFSQ